MRYEPLPKSLEFFAEKFPTKIAFIDGERQITYQELLHNVQKISAYLQHENLKNKCVALHLPNSLELIYLYLACFRVGAIAVPLNIMLKKPEIEYVLEDTDPQILITNSHYFNELKKINLHMKVVVCGEPIPNVKTIPFQELLNHSFILNKEWPPESKPAAIFYTSGSTGKPKGVVHSQKSMSAMAKSMSSCFDMTSQDIFLGYESISNASGCTHVMMLLQSGGTFVILEAFELDNYMAHLRRFKPTLLCIMSRGNYEIVNAPNISREDFSSVRINMTGGDKIPTELIQAFQEKTNVPLELGYGMSEILLITINKNHAPTKRGSVGKATENVQIQLRDPQGKIVPQGEIGEAWLKGPNLLLNYWHNEEENQKSFVDAWFRTGDLLRCDEDGYYWFFGRLKHLIVRQGDNISPLEVEKALTRHPAVLDAGVVGAPDREEGEVPVAFVELKKNMTVNTETLLEFLGTQLEDFKIPTKLTILATLPRTKNGKIDRERLKNL